MASCRPKWCTRLTWKKDQALFHLASMCPRESPPLESVTDLNWILDTSFPRPEYLKLFNWWVLAVVVYSSWAFFVSHSPLNSQYFLPLAICKTHLEQLQVCEVTWWWFEACQSTHLKSHHIQLQKEQNRERELFMSSKVLSRCKLNQALKETYSIKITHALNLILCTLPFLLVCHLSLVFLSRSSGVPASIIHIYISLSLLLLFL